MTGVDELTSKRAARLTLISTSIVSGLLLILYLPVLIWSPPWDSSKGCYNSLNDRGIKLVRFENGVLIGLWGDEVNTLDGFKHTSKNHWQTRFSNDQYNVTVEVITSESQIKLNATGGAEDISFTGVKTFNPFTIWHIKWLEWTN